MVIHREYWQHKRTGQIWAVELRDGVILRAAGPVGRIDAAHPQLIHHLPMSGDSAVWVEHHRGEFIPYEATV